MLRLAIISLCIAAIAVNETSFAKNGNDPGPYRAPLKPAVLPKKGSDPLATVTVPADVETAIKASAKTGDVYSVTQQRQNFDGQVLKVDVLVFQERTALILTKFDVPWVAIVAKKVQFVAPETNNAIVTESSWTPRRHIPPIAPGAPGKQPKAPECKDGGGGINGSNGSPGTSGDDAPQPPKVYLIAGAIVNKFDVPLPEAFNFIFDVRGYSGGEGGNGGQGGAGGAGGDGGPGDWHDPATYPFDPGCKCGAGFGGPGGSGGRGGPGGVGGNSSAGASLAWVATRPVLDSLYFARVYNQGGFGGPGGIAGPSGPSGRGGARGEWEGGCQGGGQGKTPKTPATPPIQSQTGANSARGIITQEEVTTIDRFY